MRTLLEEDEDLLDACENRLTESVLATKTTTANAAAATANAATHLARFKKAEKAARKRPCTTVERKPLQLLLSCTTAREIWMKLNSMYNLRSDKCIELVQKKFFEFKWNESDSISFNIYCKINRLSLTVITLAVSSLLFLNLKFYHRIKKKFNHAEYKFVCNLSENE